MHCPNCNKEIKYAPKGKCTCSCGQVLESDGRDVREFKFSESKMTLRDRLPSLIELQIIFAIILVIGAFVLRVMHQKSWFQYEAEFMHRTFGIEPETYKFIMMLIIGGICILWLGYKFFSFIRRTFGSITSR